MEEKKWLTDEMWNVLKEKPVVFAFEQGEKYLSVICAVSEKLTEKCFTLLGIIVGICPFLIASIYTFKNQYFIIVASTFSIVCIVLCFMLLKLIQPRIGYSIGRSPKEILNKELVEYWNSNEETVFEKYELENLQHKIEKTLEANDQRAKTYKIILYTLLISFSILIILSSLVLIFLFLEVEVQGELPHFFFP
ncbi:MAG: hypothetical protein LLG05_01425 [Porphyromonadaceae bacterium]|nr:hypothetical protein [Porphyromonadaceae bacterium]